MKSVAFVNDDVRKSESSSIYWRDSLSENLSLTPNLFITGKELADAFNEKVGAGNFYLKPNSSGLYYLPSNYPDKSTVAISMSPALSYLFGWSTKDGERMPKLTSILFGNDLQSGYPFNIESTTHGKLTFFRLQNSREKWPLSFNTNTDVWNLIKGSFQVVQIDSDIVQEEYVGSETSQTLAFLPFYYKKKRTWLIFDRVSWMRINKTTFNEFFIRLSTTTGTLFKGVDCTVVLETRKRPIF